MVSASPLLCEKGTCARRHALGVGVGRSVLRRDLLGEGACRDGAERRDPLFSVTSGLSDVGSSRTTSPHGA